ncbi:hypothetical protein Q4I28_003584 [Leishmania naiffi]|uniref:Secreted protein n=1 Tax=Leishmania naiffi TaxID=5678 RepID=A0AAW3BTH5_9TRYP
MEWKALFPSLLPTPALSVSAHASSTELQRCLSPLRSSHNSPMVRGHRFYYLPSSH